MGVFDFVKQGVKAGMIARADHLKHLIVYKHPDQNFPMYSQLTVDMDEAAVFFKDGRVVGVLPPGRHTMQTQNIPFLTPLINTFTGGNVFISEIFFVKTTPVRGVPFGGPAGDIIDPATGLQVPVRIFGEFSVMVVDPVRFIVGYSGQAAAGDNDQVLNWLKGKFLNSVTSVLTELCEQEQKSILSVINNKERLAQAFVQRAPNLEDIGVRITEMGRIDPNIPEKHMEELRQAVRELAEAQRQVKKKQIMVGAAQADAQARQFELDQQFGQEQRNVQQLAGGSFGQYAAGRMVMGAGQGMAEHGLGGGVAGLSAEMAVGMGMGNAMAQQMAPQGRGGAPGAPGYGPPPAGPGGPYGPPPVAAGPGGEMVCGACSARQSPGKFCRECGQTLTPPRKFCGSCGIEVGVAAKFCPNCGTGQAIAGAAAGPPSIPR